MIETFDGNVVTLLTEHADAIRGLRKRIGTDLIDIGRRLDDCRKHLRGRWLSWLDREFGWTDRTARNYIAAYELSSCDGFAEIISDQRIGPTSAYLLAAGTVTEAARREVLRRAGRGTLSHREVKAIVEQARRDAEQSGEHLAAEGDTGVTYGFATIKQEFGALRHFSPAEFQEYRDASPDRRELLIDDAIAAARWKPAFAELQAVFRVLKKPMTRSFGKILADVPAEHRSATISQIGVCAEWLTKLALAAQDGGEHPSGVPGGAEGDVVRAPMRGQRARRGLPPSERVVQSAADRAEASAAQRRVEQAQPLCRGSASPRELSPRKD